MDRTRPPTARDCLDCGKPDGMKLANTTGLETATIPLLYVCVACGCLLTIPPPIPVFVTQRD